MSDGVDLIALSFQLHGSTLATEEYKVKKVVLFLRARYIPATEMAAVIRKIPSVNVLPDCSLLGVLFLFNFCISFLCTPVPEVTGVRQSGTNPESGEDVLLQHKPGSNNCQHQQNIFHFFTSLN